MTCAYRNQYSYIYHGQIRRKKTFSERSSSPCAKFCVAMFFPQILKNHSKQK